MDNYETERFYKTVEMIGFEGIEYQQQEISPAEVLYPRYAVDHHKEYARLQKLFTKTRDPLKEKLWNISQLWGAYMEKEMERVPDHKLTKEIAKGTEEVLERWVGCCDWGYALVPHVLSTTWRHGEKLAEMDAFVNVDDIKLERAVTRDEAYSLVDSFKREKNVTPELRAQYLAEILQDPTNLQHLKKQLEKEKLSEIYIFDRKITQVMPMLSFDSAKTARKELPNVLALTEKVFDKNELTQKKKLEELRSKITKEAEKKACEVFYKKEPLESGKIGVKTDSAVATNQTLFNKVYMKKMQSLKKEKSE